MSLKIRASLAIVVSSFVLSYVRVGLLNTVLIFVSIVFGTAAIFAIMLAWMFSSSDPVIKVNVTRYLISLLINVMQQGPRILEEISLRAVYSDLTKIRDGHASVD